MISKEKLSKAGKFGVRRIRLLLLLMIFSALVIQFLPVSLAAEYSPDKLPMSGGASQSMTPPTDEWPMYGHDAQHSGLSGFDAPDNNTIEWIFDSWDLPPDPKFPPLCFGAPITSASVADDKVFVTFGEPCVAALDKDTGEMIWWQEVNGWGSQPVFDDDKVYVASVYLNITPPTPPIDPLAMYVFDADTGEQLQYWEIEVENVTTLPPVITVANGKVFAGESAYLPPPYAPYPYTIFAFNQTTGDLLWRRGIEYQAGNASWKISSPQLTVTNTKVIVSTGTSKLYALDESTGNTVWVVDKSPEVFAASSAAHGDKVFAGTNCNGKVYAFNENDGNVIWSHQIEQFPDCWTGGLATPSIADGKVFVSYGDFFGDGAIIALEENTGDSIWEFNSTGGYSAPSVGDGKVFANTGQGIQALDEDTGEVVWLYDDFLDPFPFFYGFFEHSPAIAYGKLFIVDGMAEKLYAFGPNGSSPPPQPDEPPVIMVFEPGGNPGEEYHQGDEIMVTWWAYDDNPLPPNPINISYGDPIVGWTRIASMEPNDGLYLWDTTHVPCPETYWMNLTVYDSEGQESYDWSDFSYNVLCPGDPGNNTPPVAIAEPSLQIVFVGEEAWFSGAMSYDPDGYIVSYEWDFGDGTYGSGMFEFHEYDKPGNYTITLTVTDNEGATDTDTIFVIVLDGSPPEKQPPVIEVLEPGGIPGQVYYQGDLISVIWIAFDDYPLPPNPINISYGDPIGGWTRIATMEPNDGFYIWDTTGVPCPGTYWMNLSVFDSDGQTTYDESDYSFEISCSGGGTNDTTPPFITATIPVDGATDVELSQDIVISFSEPIKPDTFAYTIVPDPGGWTWAWSISNTVVVGYHNDFVPNTLYTFTVTAAEDLAGNPLRPGPVPNPWFWITGDGDKPPQNQPPIATAEPPQQSIFVGEEAWFSGNASFDPDGYIVSYDWDFGDGSNGSGIFVTHSYLQSGNYLVTLTVTDNEGGIGIDFAMVDVLEKPPSGNATVWIDCLGTNKFIYDIGETVHTTVVVMRGNDVLTMVWEGSLELEVFDSEMNLVYTETEEVILPSGGSTATYFFDFALDEAGEYLIRATLFWKVDGSVQDIEEITILVEESEPPQEPKLEITKVKTSGMDEVYTYTYYEWELKIAVSNVGEGCTIQDVVVTDVLPAQLELLDYSLTKGTLEVVKMGKGEMGSTHLTWYVGNLGAKGVYCGPYYAELALKIATTKNSAGEQEFTSPGTYALNIGASATGIDKSTGKNYSAGPTDPIMVVAVDKKKPSLKVIEFDPELILSAGMNNIATFEEGIERMVPVEVAAYYGDVHNVRLELIDDGGLEIEVIPMVQDVGEGQIVRFYLKIKAPVLPEDVEYTGMTIKLKAIGDEAESNMEYIDVMIRTSGSSWSPEIVGAVTTVATCGTAAFLAGLIRRRKL